MILFTYLDDWRLYEKKLKGAPKSEIAIYAKQLFDKKHNKGVWKDVRIPTKKSEMEIYTKQLNDGKHEEAIKVIIDLVK